MTLGSFRRAKCICILSAFGWLIRAIKVYKRSTTTANYPVKSVEGWELEPSEKRYNKALAKLRLSIEHVNCKLNVFRILSERYRGRRRRFGLRFNLISGFYNFELGLKA